MCSTAASIYPYQCRLCRKVSCELEHIFGKRLKAINLASMIYKTVSLSVEEDGPLPKMICPCCLEKVEAFNAFRIMCQWSDDAFKPLLGEKSSFLLEPECCLNEDESDCSVPEGELEPEKANCGEKVCDENQMSVHSEGNPATITASVTDTSELSKVSLLMDSSGVEARETVLKEPCPEDYVLFREETFSLGNVQESSLQSAVEFCKPSILPSDRVIVSDTWKRREILPQMWDVYEKKIEENNLLVTWRRYLISKTAFPCSLCDSCVSVGHEKLEVEDKVKQEHNLEIAVQPEDTSVPLVCTYCHKSFQGQASLQRHIQSHFDFKSLCCKLCLRGFSRKEHLARHILVHTGNRPYRCDICSKTFTRKEHLTRHRTGNHVKVLGPMKSSYGPQEVIKNIANVTNEVQQPITTNIKSVKQYICEVCFTEFSQKEHLTRHCESAHGRKAHGRESEGALHKCKLCSRSFSRKEHLLRHQKIHMRDYMFVNDSQVVDTGI